MAPRLLALIAAGFFLTGCVAQDKYKALELETQALKEQLQRAEADSARNKSAADAWKSQLDALMAKGGDLASVNASLNSELAELRAQNQILTDKYEKAQQDKGQIVNVLPVALQSELQKFAAENPELVEFDAARGILKFKSDVTFAKGSADLTPQAKHAIQRFAQILNSPAARNYDFLVAGHTDSTPVSNPETKRRGHIDNWYLSSHRAISVGSELATQGVSPRRLGVVGYADQRPVASNGSADGQARNRRVEVAILPTGSGDATAVDAGPTAPVRRTTTNTPAPTVRRPAMDLNKDTVITDPRPVLNK